MTNARQIRQVFGPLLERHDDLFQIGTRWLCVKPVHHVALRVFIESSSHPNYASPLCVMRPAFLLHKSIENTIGCHSRHFFRESIKERYWEWSDPTMVDDLIKTIDEEVLPILRSVRSLAEYGALYHETLDKSLFEDDEDRLVIYAALGELESARNLCSKLLPEYAEDKYPNWPLYQKHRTQVMTLAEPLLAGDKRQLALILHEWEAATIRGSKLERYWEPTPFPIEYV